ncbi:MAG TPA: adenylate/guanylate cyclase domain-containing protein [Burkholderiaceae bacterium]|nr:adenylate/guanylate cyclase domain-containing protein [Burkholderiaceae bacterium]
MTEHSQAHGPVDEPLGRILVVDDNELNRDLLSRRLIKSGFVVAVAADGLLALDWLEKNPCDLILLDIMMPGMSGVDVLAKLRQTHDGTVLPIIMVSANDTREDIVGALQTGANDYVSKPIDYPVVLARVHAQLALKRANDKVRALVVEVERRNAFIRQVFGRYLTDDVVEAILDAPDGLRLGGERREITIMMADIRGFTHISSKLEATDVVAMVNNFLSKMTEVILRHGGTIDEFIGDAVLVLFGAPRPLENHAPRAVACAIEMQQVMEEVNRLNDEAGLARVSAGIGINTGEVVVGNIGSARRLKYGVVGHNVNFTSRIESYTAGGEVLVSRRTRELCGDILQVVREIKVTPKGFDEEVELAYVGALGGDYQLSLPTAG